MDKFRLFVISLGTVILVTFSLYNFGYHISPSVPQSGAEVQPASTSDSKKSSGTTELTSNSAQLQSEQNNSKQNSSKQNSSSTNTISNSHPDMKMATFENREKPENFFSIQFPINMRAIHGNGPGSLVAISPQGDFSVDLVDIPDDSNVELYLLTKIKSSLESSLHNFNQTKFSPTSIGGHRAWELVYTWKNATTPMGSIKAFVEGQDEAIAITYSGTYQQLIDKNINSTLIQPVLQSFRWIV